MYRKLVCECDIAYQGKKLTELSEEGLLDDALQKMFYCTGYKLTDDDSRLTFGSNYIIKSDTGAQTPRLILYYQNDDKDHELSSFRSLYGYYTKANPNKLVVDDPVGTLDVPFGQAIYVVVDEYTYTIQGNKSDSFKDLLQVSDGFTPTWGINKTSYRATDSLKSTTLAEYLPISGNINIVYATISDVGQYKNLQINGETPVWSISSNDLVESDLDSTSYYGTNNKSTFTDFISNQVPDLILNQTTSNYDLISIDYETGQWLTYVQGNSVYHLHLDNPALQWQVKLLNQNVKINRSENGVRLKSHPYKVTSISPISFSLPNALKTPTALGTRPFRYDVQGIIVGRSAVVGAAYLAVRNIDANVITPCISLTNQTEIANPLYSNFFVSHNFSGERKESTDYVGYLHTPQFNMTLNVRSQDTHVEQPFIATIGPVLNYTIAETEDESEYSYDLPVVDDYYDKGVERPQRSFTISTGIYSTNTNPISKTVTLEYFNPGKTLDKDKNVGWSLVVAARAEGEYNYLKTDQRYYYLYNDEWYSSDSPLPTETSATTIDATLDVVFDINGDTPPSIPIAQAVIQTERTKPTTITPPIFTFIASGLQVKNSNNVDVILIYDTVKVETDDKGTDLYNQRMNLTKARYITAGETIVLDDTDWCSGYFIGNNAESAISTYLPNITIKRTQTNKVTATTTSEQAVFYYGVGYSEDDAHQDIEDNPKTARATTSGQVHTIGSSEYFAYKIPGSDVIFVIRPFDLEFSYSTYLNEITVSVNRAGDDDHAGYLYYCDTDKDVPGSYTEVKLTESATTEFPITTTFKRTSAYHNVFMYYKQGEDSTDIKTIWGRLQDPKLTAVSLTMIEIENPNRVTVQYRKNDDANWATLAGGAIVSISVESGSTTTIQFKHDNMEESSASITLPTEDRFVITVGYAGNYKIALSTKHSDPITVDGKTYSAGSQFDALPPFKAYVQIGRIIGPTYWCAHVLSPTNFDMTSWTGTTIRATNPNHGTVTTPSGEKIQQGGIYLASGTTYLYCTTSEPVTTFKSDEVIVPTSSALRITASAKGVITYTWGGNTKYFAAPAVTLYIDGVATQTLNNGDTYDIGDWLSHTAYVTYTTSVVIKGPTITVKRRS